MSLLYMISGILALISIVCILSDARKVYNGFLLFGTCCFLIFTYVEHIAAYGFAPDAVRDEFFYGTMVAIPLLWAAVCLVILANGITVARSKTAADKRWPLAFCFGYPIVTLGTMALILFARDVVPHGVLAGLVMIVGFFGTMLLCYYVNALIYSQELKAYGFDYCVILCPATEAEAAARAATARRMLRMFVKKPRIIVAGADEASTRQMSEALELPAYDCAEVYAEGGRYEIMAAIAKLIHAREGNRMPACAILTEAENMYIDMCLSRSLRFHGEAIGEPLAKGLPNAAFYNGMLRLMKRYLLFIVPYAALAGYVFFA